MVARDSRSRKDRRTARRRAPTTTTTTPRTRPTELFAEDVNRGYRLDVEDQTKPGSWLSLHQRTGDVPVAAAATVPRLAAAGGDPTRRGLREGRVDDGRAGQRGQLYLHEAVFGWDGWSLAAKRPGQAINNDRGVGPSEPDDVENPYPMPLVTALRGDTGHVAAAALRPQLPVPCARGRPRGQLGAQGRPGPQHVTPRAHLARSDPVPSPGGRARADRSPRASR